MKVFIANFGRANFLWPTCLGRGTIATVDDGDVHPFWEARDRDGYVAYTVTHKKTVRGETPIKPVASRWYGLMDVISETAGDLWIHREKEGLWWTTSTAAPVQIELHPLTDAGVKRPAEYQLHKPCTAWLNRARSGAPLSWTGLHPKARDFLFTEGTLQQLRPDNAEYAVALVNGDDLAPWHNQEAWQAKVGKTGKAPVTYLDAKTKAIWRMVNTVKQTVHGSNGQQVLRTVKNKELRFTEEELKAHIDDLLAEQDGLCALTGLPLQFDGNYDEAELLCSLDRIESDGHYEAGNLQVVCRFANRWKNDGNDEGFRHLIDLVRSARF